MDGASADILRRGMSAVNTGRKSNSIGWSLIFLKVRGAWLTGRVITEVWRQVSSFAGYSFSKAHSASFAVESYQSLFLKTYYAREFMVGVLNNYGGFYSRWLYVHELQKAGAIVHLPCVNNSESAVCIKGIDAWLGFTGIQGLESTFIESIPHEQNKNGHFGDLENFVKRTNIGLEQAIILIRAGALRFTGKSKKVLLWDVHTLLGNKPKSFDQPELFHVETKEYAMPELVNTKLEDAYHELELLGFPLTLSMFDLLKTPFRGDVKAAELGRHIGKLTKMVGRYVCEKTVHTKNNKTMWFGTFLDFDGNFFDTTHFPNNTPAYPFRGTGCYLIFGKVVADFGFPSLEVIRFAKLDIWENPVMG
ncbi:MAG: hypothetical protein WKI04_04825 [Ferruginibacter sp.]